MFSLLFQNILKEPFELEPRLVLADFLLENGNPLGDFINVQCGITFRLPRTRILELRLRSKHLLETHGKQWSKPISGLTSKYLFRNGFIEKMDLSSNQFIEHATPIYKRHPACIVRLHSLTDSDLEKLSTFPETGHIRKLYLQSAHGTTLTNCNSFLQSPLLSRLHLLSLSGISITNDLLEHLVDRPWPSLTSLDLSCAEADDSSLATLSQADCLSSLQTLYIKAWENSTERGWLTLIQSPYLKNLRKLCMANNEVTDDFAQALALPSTLPNLQRIEISQEFLTPKLEEVLRNRRLWKGH
jgi:uncharacterized protein (TIGR02996 family)